MGVTTFLFIISVVIYYIFKVDIVLWFRRAFPVFYTNKGNILPTEDSFAKIHSTQKWKKPTVML